MAKKTIKDLKFDTHNFNQHTAKGMALLEKSIEENGYGRSILVDKNDNIVAGNGVTEIAKGKDAKIKVVETTGDELIVVKRTDLDIDSEKGRNIAMADNAIAQANLKWNEEEIAWAKEQWGGANNRVESGKRRGKEAERNGTPIKVEIRRYILHTEDYAYVKTA